MKRFFSALMLAVLTSAFSLAAPSEATLILVKATHQRVHRHRAHKAAKHHRPKRSHHRGV
ncbi:MAG: hypothetical protein ABR881_03740 [Candidatus Sulfotelmatobacter sp.]